MEVVHLFYTYVAVLIHLFACLHGFVFTMCMVFAVFILMLHGLRLVTIPAGVVFIFGAFAGSACILSLQLIK
jgi:hypothetical protein